MARRNERDGRTAADALATHHARIHELGRHPLWQVNDAIARGCTRGGLLELADAIDRLHQAHDGVAELESGEPVRPCDLLAAYDEGPGACTIYVDDPEYAAPVEHELVQWSEPDDEGGVETRWTLEDAAPRARDARRVVA